MVLVVRLTIRRDSVEEYRAASIMAKHGAKIERTVVVQSDQDMDTLKEVHVVRFPNSKALMAYKTDPELLELTQIRERVVLGTEVLVGEDGPDYGTVARDR